MYESEAIAEIAAALAKAQSEMEPATFNRSNPHFKNKYADLAAIFEAIKKPLTANGISVTQQTKLGDGAFVLRTTIRHAPSGQWIASEFPLPLNGRSQEIGAAITYARRYSLTSLVGMSTEEDDDANAANDVRATSPIKPVKIEAPVHPETGEVGPHLITAKDEASWGGLFVAAINTARDDAEIDQWLVDNKSGLQALEGAAPKLYQTVKNAVTSKRKSFKKDAA